MSLFSADLYRNFAIGFLAGAILVSATTVDQWGPQIESAAHAAPMLKAPEAAQQFRIEPLEITE